MGIKNILGYAIAGAYSIGVLLNPSAMASGDAKSKLEAIAKASKKQNIAVMKVEEICSEPVCASCFEPDTNGDDYLSTFTSDGKTIYVISSHSKEKEDFLFIDNLCDKKSSFYMQVGHNGRLISYGGKNPIEWKAAEKKVDNLIDDAYKNINKK